MVKIRFDPPLHEKATYFYDPQFPDGFLRGAKFDLEQKETGYSAQLFLVLNPDFLDFVSHLIEVREPGEQVAILFKDNCIVLSIEGEYSTPLGVSLFVQRYLTGVAEFSKEKGFPLEEIVFQGSPQKKQRAIPFLFYDLAKIEDQVNKKEKIIFFSQGGIRKYSLEEEGARTNVLYYGSIPFNAVILYTPEEGRYRPCFELSFQTAEEAREFLQRAEGNTDFLENYALSLEEKKVTGKGLGLIDGDEIVENTFGFLHSLDLKVAGKGYPVIAFSNFPVEPHLITSQLRFFRELNSYQ